MPVITITQGSLRATHKLTNRLSKELNCRIISREDVIEHGKKYGIDEFLFSAKRIMETKPPHSWDPQATQIHQFLVIIKAALMDFVVEGDVIYHGLQTHFLLTDVPRVLRTKVVAPMEYRVKTLAEETDFSEAEAREHILHVDEQRVSWAKFLYGENFDDPTYYDIILNMSNLNLDAMVEIIARVTRRPEFRLDAGAMKSIRDAHLKALILAYLVRFARTRDMDLSIECDSESGHVKVRRNAPTPSSGDWQKDIEDALSGLEQIFSLEITEFK